MKPPEIVRSRNFARDAAVFIVEKARRAIAAHGLFRLGLAGGKTPAQVYEEVARLGAELPWERVQITFGDERCVPPDDPESNYLMAKSTLLDRISIREPNVFRIRGELGAEKAAREYEQKLAAVSTRLGEARYIHDLLLLGLGRDGHTASLFPGALELNERVRNVVPASGPTPPKERVTLTFPLINAARHVCFLVNDPAKEPLVDEIVAGQSQFPAAAVQPHDGTVTWMLGG